MANEKRFDSRCRKRFIVEYLVETGLGAKAMVRTNTTDISTTGMRLGASRRLPMTQIRIDFRIFFDDRNVISEGEIIWRKGTMMGVRFTDPSPALLLAISLALGRRINHQLESDLPDRPHSRDMAFESPYPLPKGPLHKPVPLDVPDLQEKWLSRIHFAVDPHEKWLARRFF